MIREKRDPVPGAQGFGQKCMGDRSAINVLRERHRAINVEHTTKPQRVKCSEERAVDDKMLCRKHAEGLSASYSNCPLLRSEGGALAAPGKHSGIRESEVRVEAGLLEISVEFRVRQTNSKPRG